MLFRYGRRTSFFCLLFMEISISIITCFSPNYVVFTVLRTINGFTFPAIFQIPFILSEYFPLSNRETGHEPMFEFFFFQHWK